MSLGVFGGNIPKDLLRITKRCRQCFVAKPLSCYLNQAKNGFCVVCDKCRSSQRRRYHAKRAKKLQSIDKLVHSQTNQLIKSSSASTIANNKNSQSDYCKSHEDIKSLYIVPHPLWVLCDNCQNKEVFVAKYVYHETVGCTLLTPPSSPASSTIYSVDTVF